MITLFGLPPAGGLRQPSPFVLKVEMALSYLGLSYNNSEVSILKINKLSPTGKVPWIKVGNELIGDSELILAHLDNTNQGRLYDHLSDREKSLGMAYLRLAEHHLFWLMVSARWLHSNQLDQLKTDWFGSYPKFVSDFIAKNGKRNVERFCFTQGIGRLNQKEQFIAAKQDLESLAYRLESNDYLLGEFLTVYDFSISSLLSCIVEFNPSNWLSDLAKDYPVLKTYMRKTQKELTLSNTI